MSTEIEVVVTGPPGPVGPVGPEGPVGPIGPHPTLTVGDVTTGTPDAEFVDDGQDGYELNLTLPPGPELSIGTVDTGATADAEVTGNPHDGYVLDLTLPPVGANGVNTGAIQNGAVTSDKIADGSIVAGDIAANADIAPTQIAGTAVVASTVDAKGDLLAGTADNTVARLPAGTNGRVLTTDSTQAAGLRWAPIGVPDLDIGMVDTGTPAAASLTGTPETGYELDLTLPPVGNGSISNIAVAADADIACTKIAGTALTSAGLSVFNVKDYGAVGDGVTDDTAAIQAAVDAAAAVSGTVLFPAVADNGGYLTTETITVPPYTDVTMHAPIIYDGAGGETALLVDGPTPAGANTNRALELRVRRATLSDWTDETDIGIQLVNLYRSKVTIGEVTNFTVGVQFFGDAFGVAYNTVELLKIYDCMVGVDLFSDNSGWVNENLFLGGNFQNSSSTYSGALNSVSRYGIRIGSGESYNNNANVFIKPSFELWEPTAPAESVPVVVDYGMYNRFVDCRDEANGPTFIRTLHTARYNYASITFTDNPAGGEQGRVDDAGTLPSTVFKAASYQEVAAPRLAYAVTDIAKRAVFYDTDYYCVPGLMGSAWGDTGYHPYIYTSAVTATSLETLGRVGVKVDVRECRRLVLSVETEPGYGGRTFVRCFDSSGTALDPTAAPYDVSPMISANGMYATTDYGKGYVDGVDSNESQVITVIHDDVATVWVGRTAYSAALKIKAFRIFTHEVNVPAVWTDFPAAANQPIAVAAPTAGTYTLGQIVWNAEPASSEAAGWICTVAGSPGTWKAFGTIA